MNALPKNDGLIDADFAPIVSGDLEVRLARDVAEIEAAQRLRYRVFVDELGAKPDAAALATGRDADKYDEYCDHLLVLDRLKGEGAAAIVGPITAILLTVGRRQFRERVAAMRAG
ncbi:MAG: GNAT family N-acetyltransferase [Proteobacteria bacterium]|nr:GNAT family N-acetyltransferase [Pseudomonadota bacterium]